MYHSSAVSLHPSDCVAPALLNFWRNSHGFLCVCVRVCLLNWLHNRTHTATSESSLSWDFPIFLDGWEEYRGRQGGEEIREGWILEREVVHKIWSFTINLPFWSKKAFCVPSVKVLYIFLEHYSLIFLLLLFLIYTINIIILYQVINIWKAGTETLEKISMERSR